MPQGRFGCHLSGLVYLRQMVRSQIDPAHQPTGIERSTFCPNKVVLLKMDNSTSVAYVNNEGGTHSGLLMSLALEMWTWCLHRDILVTTQNVPWKENNEADRESHIFHDSSDLQLNPKIIASFLTNCNTRSLCQSPNSTTALIDKLETRSRSLLYFRWVMFSFLSCLISVVLKR